MNIVIIILGSLISLIIIYLIYWEIKLKGKSPLELSALMINKTKLEVEEILRKNKAKETKREKDDDIFFQYLYGKQLCEGFIDFLNKKSTRVKIISVSMIIDDFSKMKSFNFDSAWQKISREGYKECYKIQRKENEINMIQYFGINLGSCLTIEAVLVDED